ncbi:MAG: (2Fe-2S)-binding protein [Ekhidna sp.]|nr:(2Fe-2S)-binding protein [Ekhidna sp.]
MPTVVIANLKSTSIRFEDKGENLLEMLLSATDWMHACGKKGRCTSCRAKILQGAGDLSPLSKTEKQFLELNKLQKDERLTCQTQVYGDVRVEVPKPTQLPHLEYSE